MEQLTIKVDKISARIVAEMLEFYNLYQLEQAEARDKFLDNSPYKKAIRDFLKSYNEATEQADK